MATLLDRLPWRKGVSARLLHSEGDNVAQLRFFDDTPPLRASVLAWTFRFDNVLDHEKLRDAVTRLLNVPSWSQLGARLKLSVG